MVLCNDDREWLMRWMADEYLDTAMDSTERRELDQVVLAIKACDYADDLDSALFINVGLFSLVTRVSPSFDDPSIPEDHETY